MGPNRAEAFRREGGPRAPPATRRRQGVGTPPSPPTLCSAPVSHWPNPTERQRAQWGRVSQPPEHGAGGKERRLDVTGLAGEASHRGKPERQHHI